MFVDGGGKVVWTDQSRTRVWDNFTAACDLGGSDPKSKASGSSATTNTKSSQGDLTLGFFDAGTPSSLDVCQYPEYSHLHGVWESPSTLHTIRMAVPIFSAAVPSTVREIPVPAPAYTNGRFAYK